jgi:DNA invertase Pin-like site-specific DNA recombinase
MARRAVAYIRRSSGRESPLSLGAQQDAITRASEARGDVVAETFTDWGKSGEDRARPEFLRLTEAVAAGGVSTVYSFDSDRLGRRTATVAAFMDLCEDTGTALVDGSGRNLVAEDQRQGAEHGAVSDAAVLRKIKARNRANRDRKRARGDDLGESPYGWTKQRLTEDGHNRRGRPALAGAVVDVCTDPRAITTVLNAYHAAGSALGAAFLLNAAPIRTRRGRTWNNRAVFDIVQREAPELLPARLGRRNARHYRVRVLSGLLRCYCGALMSPNGDGWTCGQGARGAHARPYNVAEAKVLPWVREEAARVVTDVDELGIPGEAPDLSADRARLEAARDLIGEAAYADALAKLDDRAGEAERRRVEWQAVPQGIDWERWAVEDINAALRALWHHVTLGADLLPVSAEWRVPEWRRP